MTLSCTYARGRGRQLPVFVMASSFSHAACLPEQSAEPVASFLQLHELPCFARAATSWRDATRSNAVWAVHHRRALQKRFVACQASTGWSTVPQEHFLPAVLDLATAERFGSCTRHVVRSLSVRASQRTRRFSIAGRRRVPTHCVYLTACGTEMLFCQDAVAPHDRAGISHWAIDGGPADREQLAFFGTEGLQVGVMAAWENGKSLRAISGWQDGQVLLADVRSNVLLTSSLSSAINTLDVDWRGGNFYVAETAAVHKLGAGLEKLLERRIPESRWVSKMRFCSQSEMLLLAFGNRASLGDDDQTPGAIVELWNSSFECLFSWSPGRMEDAAGIGALSSLAAPGMMLLALQEAIAASPALLRLDVTRRWPPKMQRLRDQPRVTAMCTPENGQVLLGCVTGLLMLLVVEEEPSGPEEVARVLATGAPHGSAVSTVMPIAGFIVSSANDFRIVVSSATSGEDGCGQISAMRYIECDEPAWSAGFSLHRAAFAGSGTVTVLDFLALPGPEDFGLVPGARVRMEGLAVKPELNGTVGVVAALPQVPARRRLAARELKRGRVGVDVEGRSLSVAFTNLRLQAELPLPQPEQPGGGQQ